MLKEWSGVEWTVYISIVREKWDRTNVWAGLRLDMIVSGEMLERLIEEGSHVRTGPLYRRRFLDSLQQMSHSGFEALLDFGRGS